MPHARDDLAAGLSLPAQRRAPAADGGRRADPHFAGRSRGARTLCALLRLQEPGRFRQPLLAHLHKVQEHYARLFEKAPQLVAEQRNLSFSAEDEDRDTLDKLSEMGFRQPREVYATVRRWLSGRYNALKGEQAREYLAELVPLLLEQFRRGENPDGVIADFDRFLAGLRAGGRFLSLLRQNPELLRFVALILGVAPRLADILAQQPQVIDPLLDPTLLRRLAGRSAARNRTRSIVRSSRQLRGLPRQYPPVWTGAYVSDRRANPVGHGLRRAGRPGICAPRRRPDPLAPPYGRADASRPCTAASAARIRRSLRSAGLAPAR